MAKNELAWWRSPNYLAAEEALQEEGKKQMERQEARARRERNAALLSDIARVGAQVWAHDGGAWKIDRATPSAIAANSRLQEVRDRNAANMMLYAQRRQEAKRKDDEDAMNRHRMQLTLEQQQRENEQAQAKAAAAAQQQRFDNALKLKSADETKRHNEAMEKNQREREARLWLQQGGGGGGSPKDKIAPIYVLNADGSRTEYPVSEYGDLALSTAYNKVIADAPWLISKVQVGSNRIVEAPSPSKEQMLTAIAKYNNWRAQVVGTQLPISTTPWLYGEQGDERRQPLKKAYKNNKGKGY